MGEKKVISYNTVHNKVLFLPHPIFHRLRRRFNIIPVPPRFILTLNQ